MMAKRTTKATLQNENETGVEVGVLARLAAAYPSPVDLSSVPDGVLQALAAAGRIERHDKRGRWRLAAGRVNDGPVE